MARLFICPRPKAVSPIKQGFYSSIIKLLARKLRKIPRYSAFIFQILIILSKKTADRLAEINLTISRLEVQTRGELEWVLPINMQQRALQNVEFSKFLLGQYEEFDAYYDNLDDYARQNLST